MFNQMMHNREEQIKAQKRRLIKRSAFYLRKTARNMIKRGSSKVQNVPTRYFSVSTGQFETGYVQKRQRKRSTAPNPPLHHPAGGKYGMKSLWAEPYKGSKDAYIVAPLVFSSKGAAVSKFRAGGIHRVLAKGGSGRLQMPVNDNNALSKHQLFTRGMKKASWSWVPVRYKPRPYISNAIAPTRAKFKSLYFASKERW